MTMENKRVFYLGRVVELVFTGLMLVCLFLPSLKFESTALTNMANEVAMFFGGKATPDTMKESLSILDVASINQDVMVVMLLFAGLCLVNMAMKVRIRLRLTTFLVMLCGIVWMMVVVVARQEIRQHAMGFVSVDFGLGFWLLVVALLGLFVGLFIPEPNREESAVGVVRARWPYFVGGVLVALLIAVGVAYFLSNRDYNQQAPQQPAVTNTTTANS